MDIDFYLDVICPWCWIGARNLRTAMQELQDIHPAVAVRLAWHAEPLQPQIPDEGIDFQAFYLARLGSRQAVHARRAQVNAVARSVGLHIDFDSINTFPNSRLACALINHAQASLPIDRVFELVESIFAAFFVQGRNIGQPEVLKPLALAAGVNWDTACLTAPQPRGVLCASGVPHFVFSSQQALTGAVPATDLLHAMTRAVVAAPPQ